MRNLSNTVCSKLKWFAPLVVLTLSRAGVAAEPETAGLSAQTPTCKDAGVSVTFPEGSAELDRNAKGALSGVATWVVNGDKRTVRLSGFTDKTGSVESNQMLSEKRAQAAKDFLVGHGVESDKVTIVGHGEAQDGHETPSEARQVAVTACDVPTPVAAAEPEPAPEAAPPVEAVPPAPEPVQVAEAPLPPPAPIATAPAPKLGPPSKIGIEAAVGVGAIGFIDEGPKSVTGVGEQWDARLTFGSRSYLAIEAAYVGSLQSINSIGLSSDALLLGNGGRGYAAHQLHEGALQPYIFGGAGWTHYKLNNTAINDLGHRERGRRRHRADGGGPLGAPGQGVLDRRARYLPRHVQRGPAEHGDGGHRPGFIAADLERRRSVGV